MQRLSFVMVSAAFFAVFGTSAAFARPNVVLKLEAKIVQKDDKGAEKLSPIADDSELKPGETVRYIIVATNAGDDAATHLMPLEKIAANTVIDQASVSKSDSLRVEFSLDGGKTWSVKPTVKVQTTAGLIEKPADPSLITTLRWIGAKPLQPKTSETYSYQVRIK